MPLEGSSLDILGKAYPLVSAYDMNPSDYKLCEDFSYIKLGSISHIKEYGERLAELARNTIPTLYSDEWVIANVTGEVPHAAYYLADVMCSSLGKEHIVTRFMPWDIKQYYLDLSIEERERLLRGNVGYDGPALNGMKVLLVDDALSSGTAMRVNGEVLLKAGGEDLFTMCLLYIGPPFYRLEDSIGRTAFEKRGVELLIELINDKDNVMTSRLVTVAGTMDDANCDRLLRAIDEDKKEELLRYARILSKNRPKLQSFLKLAEEL